MSIVLSICTLSKISEKIFSFQVNLYFFGVYTVVLTEFHFDIWVQPKVEFSVKFKGDGLFYATITENSFCKMQSIEFCTNLRSICFLRPDNSVCTGGTINLDERNGYGKRRGPFFYPIVILGVTEMVGRKIKMGSCPAAQCLLDSSSHL